jgi:hypothetical protein
MDLATDLDRLIERRSTSDPDPDEREESYMQSVRRYREKERRAHLEEQRLFHRRMLKAHAETFARLLAQHRAAALKCEELLGMQPERKETA